MSRPGSRMTFALLLLFVLSGIAGLVYQSIWSHYLGLTLGHAAYAQTLVLGIFMGGMALGAWLASRWSPRWGHLVLAYAVVEAVIGVAGLVFHPLFLAYTGFSQETVLPALESAGAARAWQWTTAALLITPQCVLLGATFPLLSAGLLRLGSEGTGQVLGGLYFSNSLGAAAGALLTTFVLLPAIGMPGAVMTAGLLNIAVALLAWGIWKSRPRAEPAAAAPAADAGAAAPAQQAAPASPATADLRRLSVTLLAASAITGATSFVYEIGWIRMLNQALGTTVHSFELMLAAFILGLAFGGLWIRRRAARIADAIRYAGYAQVAMAVAALLSLVFFAQSFQGVAWMLQALKPTEQGYVLFSLGSAAVCLLVMFPAAFFAGMTLPLFTMALLQRGAGEGAIGRVYAANTLGAIAGVLLMVHVLTPLVGMRLGVVVAALVDAALGLYLLRVVSPAPRRTGYALAALATTAAAVIGLLGGRIDPRQQVSGVFRTGNAEIRAQTEVVFLRDGKAATVSLTRSQEGNLSIQTNGKPDAAMPLSLASPPTLDEPTMLMLGTLPYAYRPDAKRIAVIGWGSGLTTHTLAGHPGPELIDTVEIEPVMVEGARLFGERVARAYEDPRSKLRIEDARTYFATGNRSYDVIVSEPSNPWVAGVASLFTREFYRFVARHLDDDGVLVQWTHAYELNDALLATMLAALAEEFPATDIYLTNTSDLVFVARKGAPRPLDWAFTRAPALAPELQRACLGDADGYLGRYLGGPVLLRAYIDSQKAQPFSDFFPVVSLRAPVARFRQQNATGILALGAVGLPVLELLGGRPSLDGADACVDDASLFAVQREAAVASARAIAERDPLLSNTRRVKGGAPNLSALLAESAVPLDPEKIGYWSQLAASVADDTLAWLSPREHEGLWIAPDWVTPGQPAAVQRLLGVYAATAARDIEAMADASRALLDDADAYARLAPAAREHVLVVAQIAAIAQGDAARADALESLHGRSAGRTRPYGAIRSLVAHWPAAAAAQQPSRSASSVGR